MGGSLWPGKRWRRIIMTIPTFRRSSAPKREETKRDRKRERYRGSRQSRGYDREWELLRAEYMRHVRRQCEECRRRGYLCLADVVDHIEPIRDAPDKRLDWNNLQALCSPHHASKYKMEEYARKMGSVSLLQQWCRNPETRPAQFQIVKRGPLYGLFEDNTSE